MANINTQTIINIKYNDITMMKKLIKIKINIIHIYYHSYYIIHSIYLVM